MKHFDYSKNEIRILKKLNSSQKIQDYLNTLTFNFEQKGQTCMSPRRVMQNKTAHCMEGALFAVAALEFHGEKPWIMDLRATTRPYDSDHVVAVFKKFGCYGAISKTNHAVLRYREPVYKTLGELALSYFHEYFLDTGKKTLREYSQLLDVSLFDKLEWRTSDKELFDIPAFLDDIKHFSILSREQIKNLRKADAIEIEAGKIVEYKKI